MSGRRGTTTTTTAADDTDRKSDTMKGKVTDDSGIREEATGRKIDGNGRRRATMDTTDDGDGRDGDIAQRKKRKEKRLKGARRANDGDGKGRRR